MNNKYRHYDLSQAKRKTLNVARFGGVDFSSQKFNVDSSRAIDLKNFIYRDGLVQKRHGYEQISKIDNNKNFNGVWRFLAEDNNYHIIAHIGNLLCVLSGDLKDYEILRSDLEDYRSFAFVGSNRLWVLGGNKYLVVRFNATHPTGIVEEVEDNQDTFIPTTSIGITYQNAKAAGQAYLDLPNALTMFRKNQCLSGVGKDENEFLQTKYFEYVLDGALLTKTKVNESDEYEDIKDTTEIKKAFSKITVVLKERGTI